MRNKDKNSLKQRLKGSVTSREYSIWRKSIEPYCEAGWNAPWIFTGTTGGFRSKPERSWKSHRKTQYKGDGK